MLTGEAMTSWQAAHVDDYVLMAFDTETRKYIVRGETTGHCYYSTEFRDLAMTFRSTWRPM